jgi:hypothetical protein
MNAVADALTVTLVHSLWQHAVIATLLWTVLALLRRHGPQVRYLAACLGLDGRSSRHRSDGPRRKLRLRSRFRAADRTSAGCDRCPFDLTALDEQLGLRLEPGRGPVDVLVIERVARPGPD